MRDTQRSKVYQWENLAFDKPAHTGVEPELELRDIKKIVTKVARDYGLSHRKVRVLDGRGRRSAAYSSGERAIKMPRWSRTRFIVLHELAHWIVKVLWPMKAAAHGREFVGIYMELLRRYDERSLNEMQAMANTARIDFIPNSQATAKWLKKNGCTWNLK